VYPFTTTNNQQLITSNKQRQPWHGIFILIDIQLNLNNYTMLRYAAIFFIIAVIAAIFGFGGIASGAAEIAKVLFYIFLVLLVLTLIFGASIFGKRGS
jgi:uncharacterized membrane protein YtjA (UPF0391 family)